MTGKPSNTKGSELLAYAFTTLCIGVLNVKVGVQKKGYQIVTAPSPY